MNTFYKKFISLTFVFLLGFLAIPTAFAINCDADGDGYIVIPTAVMRQVAKDIPYNEDGDYPPIQWQDYYSIYNKAEKTEAETCDGLRFKKGAEPKRCDSAIVGASSGVYDPDKISIPLRGSQVNPGAFDTPDNGIDEDCDGGDGELLAGTPGGDTNLSDLVPRVIKLASNVVVVVSILIMIWGGVLYATAAGDEAKTSKARKAIIGAVIGLIVGLLAPAIVNWITANLV